ncbi:7-cyano-7-deazaguanine synthase QueC [Rhodopseudomonas palustris]|uniref:7-cyano-7-deazaguanine synthase 2 n=1 Tax=Rhodopseudomonas palustris (strain HaA2) TaxID=316058 RepID=QUEC2_RHOP2|nr:7-cyano-7-deazaguanine synthase QueC [Rhodopseudomonas palustris]Q2IUE0.2 RecName: Full=7-cyano-7-deazaguanine synthase 2; AltName: Full=7-cyano-7-carbaguanine synthase 2; AltName: Full=PreQ(0) synthase 2; AltName: Full=Queuosine biosynthesis protein QueC 2 [Rhodopseudomonas palustris HaA2]
MARKKVLVLHSGGMDSTTCLLQAKAEGHDVASLGIDYGQRLLVEMMFAEGQCEKYSIPRHVINVNWQKAERQIPLNRSVEEMAHSVSPAFLPGRNIVFLGLGHAHAAGIGADELQIGLNCVDFSGYPDCTTQFYDSYCTMLNIGNPGGPKLVAPLLKMSKPEIARLASTLGLQRNDTWSCYRPQIREGSIVACGECDACKLHEFAWQELK